MKGVPFFNKWYTKELTYYQNDVQKDDKGVEPLQNFLDYSPPGRGVGSGGTPGKHARLA